MTDKQTIIDGVDVLKEKINMCFILLLRKLETPETIEQTIYEHLDAFVEKWKKQLKAKEQELRRVCEAFDIEYVIDKETRELFGRCNKLHKKEQECEELKQRLHQCWTIENSFVKQLDQLEAENKKLKTDLKSLEYTVVLQSNRDIDNAVDLFAKRIAKIENENSILKAELEQEKTLKEMYFTYYKAKHSDVKGKFFRYKQALVKIKDFVENEMIPNGDTHIILQLISEVEDD